MCPHGVTSLDGESADGAPLAASRAHGEDVLVVGPALDGVDAGLEVLRHGLLGRLVSSAEVALPETREFLPSAIDCKLEGLESLVGSL